MQLVDVLLAAPGGNAGVGIKTAVGTLAHIGGVVVDDLAGVQTQPLLPHGHAQHADVHAGVVHGLQLGLQVVVALDVVQVLVALGLLQNDLALALLGQTHPGDLAEAAGSGGQKAVQDFFIVEQVFGKMVHVDINNHASLSFS